MNLRSRAVTIITTFFLTSFFILCVQKYGLIPLGTLPPSGILTERNFAEVNIAVKSELSDNNSLRKNEEDDEASEEEDDYDEDSEENEVNVKMIEPLEGKNAPSEEDRKLGYCQKRRFKDGVPFTAITSIPGSGNTWVRFLMEQVTGIYTSSAYCDGKLRKGGFMGECVGMKPGAGRNSTLGFKIHYPTNMKIYDKCVLVIRNPLKSTAAELQRRTHRNHTGVANLTEVSESKIEKKLYSWATFHNKWFKFTKPMLILLYDDLHANLRSQLLRMCDFFGSECNKKLLDCIVANNEGNFHRPKHDESELFTKEHYKLAKKLMQKVLARVNEYMPNNKRKELIL